MYKKNNLILVVAIFMIATTKLLAQTPDLLFEKQSPYPNLHPGTSPGSHLLVSYVLEVAPNEESNGYYLLARTDYKNSCFNYETESAFLPIIYKVSQQGELIGELPLGYENRYSYLCGVYPAPDNPQCFLAVGRVHNNELHYDSPFMARFDSDLNLLWQREIELPEPYREFLGIASLMDDNGHIFCSACHYECIESGPYSNFFFRMTPEGELEDILDNPLVSLRQSPFVFTDGSNDYGSLEELEGNPRQMVLLRINQDMELSHQQVLPTTYQEFDTIGSTVYISYYLNLELYRSDIPFITPLPDNSLILSHPALSMYQRTDTYSGIGFMKFDAEGNVVSCAMDDPVYPLNDSIKYVCGIPLADDNSFYFVNKIGAHGGFGYDHVNCFAVGKMDLEFNLIWRRYWNRYQPENGMKVYLPTSVVTSHDGGCLVTGCSYESTINGGTNYENSVFLLKFFADGSLDIPEWESQIRPYLLWPNPATDRLSLEYSPDVTPTAVELYDLQGRLMLSQNNNLESINVQDLPLGVYIMHVTMKDGTTYLDKVVKQ